MGRTYSDATCLVVIAPAKFCPRKLKIDGVNPGVKRYMSRGPLIAYIMACPSCGFTEMHLQEKAGFVEDSDGLLLRTEKPVRCMVCNRYVRVVDRHDGVFIEAKLELPVSL